MSAQILHIIINITANCPAPLAGIFLLSSQAMCFGVQSTRSTVVQAVRYDAYIFVKGFLELGPLSSVTDSVNY